MAVLQHCRKQGGAEAANAANGILGALGEKFIPGWPAVGKWAASERRADGLLNEK